MMKTSLLLLCLLTYPTARAAFLPPNSPVTVAIIDTGADIKHSAVSKQLWQNPGESGLDSHGFNKSNNGIDDDGNGFIDDVYGWNFADNNSDLTDDNGHGTHIAGLIGQSPAARVMILKALTKRGGEQSLLASVKAIQYAIAMHVQIINYSAGGMQPVEEERQALALAAKNHILVVAAAGNERSDMDQHGFYPAAYALPNVLSVAAVDLTGRLLPSSNFGLRSVRIAAQGKQIYSALPGEKYGPLSGTSQATALVTQAATLVCARRLNRQMPCDPNRTIQELIATGDRSLALEGKLQNPVVLNTIRVSQTSQ